MAGRSDAKKAKRELGLFLQPLIISASTSVVADNDGVKSCSLKLLSGHLARPAVTGDLEAELLAFLQIAHTGPLDGGDVNEHILAAIIRLNEAETLGGIEPFHCAGGHEEPSLLAKLCRPPATANGFRTISKGGVRQRRAKARTRNGRPSNIGTRFVCECVIFVKRSCSGDIALSRSETLKTYENSEFLTFYAKLGVRRQMI
jgi:hypothetical protein